MAQVTFPQTVERTGREVSAHQLAVLRQATDILSEELNSLEDYQFNVIWKLYGADPGQPEAVLFLESPGGTTASRLQEGPFPLDELADPGQARKLMRKTVWHYGKFLSAVVRDNLTRLEKRLSEMAVSVGG